MKRLFFTLAFCAAGLVMAFAQTNDGSANTFDRSVKYGASFEYGVQPLMGDDGAHFATGMGVQAKTEFPLSPSISLTSSGLVETFTTSLFAQNTYGYASSYDFAVPKVGLKCFLSHALFVEGEGGYAFCTSSSDFNGGPAYSFGVGLDLGRVELGGQYEAWNQNGDSGDIAQFIIRIGLRF